MEKQKMSFISKFIKSISDFESYNLLRKESKASTLVYLLILTLFLGTIVLVRPIMWFSNFVDEASHSVENDLGYFELVDGELYVEGDMPIILGEGTDNIIIFDTREDTNESILDNYDNGILFTKYSMIQKENSFKVTEQSFEPFESVYINKETVENFIPKLKYVNIPIFIVGLLFFFVAMLFTALIVSTASLILKSIQNVDISFGDIYKLSIYALTLPMIIIFSLGTANIYIPHLYKISCLATLIFLWFALKAIKNEQDPNQL